MDVEKALKKYIPKVSKGVLSYHQEQKIISRGSKVINVIVTIVKTLGLIWIFQRTYGYIGYEKTAIMLLTLILVFLRMKAQNPSDNPKM